MKFTKEHTDEAILTEAAKRNPEFLIGGFHVDNVILALYDALKNEEIAVENLSDENIQRRITAALTAAWKGIV